ncbi:hypothetical protein RB601_009212 [Gaeumannomyces tritici]
MNRSTSYQPEFLAFNKFERTLNLSDGQNGLYLYWTHVNLGVEGPIGLSWNANWLKCEHKNISGSPNPRTDFAAGNDGSVTRFEVKRGGQQVDLVAATASDMECPDAGFAISLTGKTEKVLFDNTGWPYSADEARTCALVDASPSPTPTANPCSIKINKAAAESMAAVDFKTKCNRPLDKPANCPKKGHAFPQFAAAGTTTLAAAIGALGFLLA